MKKLPIQLIAWKKVDEQTWKRGKQLLYADESYGKDGTTIYLVRFEDENGESEIYKSRNWNSALNYAKKISKQKGLIKTHQSVYKL